MMARSVFCVLSLCALAAVAADEPLQVEGHSGTVSFVSTTNMIGIEIAGRSNSVTSSAEAITTDDQLIFRRMEALVPVASLATGMKVRDEHMRKYIFRTPDGKEPDLRFSADTVTCAAAGSHEYSCPLKGSLSIRGVARPVELTMKVKEEGGSFRASTDTVVKLSTYSIERPSQFGVKPADDVKVHIELNGKARPAASTAGPLQ
jgi:polyisoprenoid-binding protein YceI